MGHTALTQISKIFVLTPHCGVVDGIITDLSLETGVSTYKFDSTEEVVSTLDSHREPVLFFSTIQSEGDFIRVQALLQQSRDQAVDRYLTAFIVMDWEGQTFQSLHRLKELGVSNFFPAHYGVQVLALRAKMILDFSVNFTEEGTPLEELREEVALESLESSGAVADPPLSQPPLTQALLDSIFDDLSDVADASFDAVSDDSRLLNESLERVELADILSDARQFDDLPVSEFESSLEEVYKADADLAEIWSTFDEEICEVRGAVEPNEPPPAQAPVFEPPLILPKHQMVASVDHPVTHAPVTPYAPLAIPNEWVSDEMPPSPPFSGPRFLVRHDSISTYAELCEAIAAGLEKMARLTYSSGYRIHFLSEGHSSLQAAYQGSEPPLPPPSPTENQWFTQTLLSQAPSGKRVNNEFLYVFPLGRRVRAEDGELHEGIIVFRRSARLKAYNRDETQLVEAFARELQVLNLHAKISTRTYRRAS